MRIRSVKPEVWTDSMTGEWDAQLTLFFIGTWQAADDSGRLRLDPRLLRAELDPFDAKFGGVEGVAELIEKLVRLGRVLPYEVEGRRFGLVAHFAAHQVINKPTKSRLPEPPEGLREGYRNPPGGVLPKVGVEGKGAGSREGNREQGTKGDPVADAPGPSVEDQVLGEWNALATKVGLPRCLGSAKVRKTIRTRAKAAGWLEAFRGALRFIEASDFHRGQNDRGWRADLEHVLQDGKAEQLAAKSVGTAQSGRLAPLGAPDDNMFVGNSVSGSVVHRRDCRDPSLLPPGVPCFPWEPAFNDQDAWHDLEAFLQRDQDRVFAAVTEAVARRRAASSRPAPRLVTAPAAPHGAFKTGEVKP